MSEDKIVKAIERAVAKISAGIWSTGYLFTIGYVLLPGALGGYTFWETIAAFLVTYIFWPLLLGGALSGNL